MKYLPFLLAFLLVVLPSITFAQTPPGGLVPCQGADCTACSVVELVNGVVKWLIGILMVVFAIITTHAGFGLVTSGGNPAAKTAAKQKLISAFIGLIIVLSAWLLVDTLMRAVLSGGDGKIEGRLWTEISCGGQAPVNFGRPATTTPSTPPSEGESEGQSAVDMASGRCGVAVNTTTPTAPSAGLCSSATAPGVISAVTGGGGQLWRWKCGNASCSVASATRGGSNPSDPGANGCGPVGAVISSRPSDASLCVLPGTAIVSTQTLIPNQPFVWACGNETCSAIYDPNASVDLRCGGADRVRVFSFPRGGDLCVDPAEVDDADSRLDTSGDDGEFNWVCKDFRNGNTVRCSAPKKTANSCGVGYGSADNTSVESLPPRSTLCAVGTYVPINDNPQNAGDRFVWNCTGVGAPVGCQATYAPPPEPEPDPGDELD